MPPVFVVHQAFGTVGLKRWRTMRWNVATLRSKRGRADVSCAYEPCHAAHRVKKISKSSAYIE
jgi:hypothetical protein